MLSCHIEVKSTIAFSYLSYYRIYHSFNDISKIIFLDGFFCNLERNKNTIEFLHSLFLHRLVSVKGLKILKDYSENGAV